MGGGQGALKRGNLKNIGVEGNYEQLHAVGVESTDQEWQWHFEVIFIYKVKYGSKFLFST